MWFLIFLRTRERQPQPNIDNIENRARLLIHGLIGSWGQFMCHKEPLSCYFLPFSSGYFGRFIDMSGFFLLCYFPFLPLVCLLSLFSFSSLCLPRDCLSCGGKWKHKQAESALWFFPPPPLTPLSLCSSTPLFHTFPLYPVLFTFIGCPLSPLSSWPSTLFGAFKLFQLPSSSPLLSPPILLPSFSLSSLRNLVHNNSSTTTDTKWWTDRIAAPLAKNCTLMNFEVRLTMLFVGKQECRFVFF